MASLWAIFRKRGKISYHDGEFSLDNLRHVDYYLRACDPVLVNITDYVVDLMETRDILSMNNVDLTPCHRSMWLEWANPKTRHRHAVHVFRAYARQVDIAGEYPAEAAAQLPKATFFVCLCNFSEIEGDIHLWGVTHLFIDQDGIPVGNAPYYGSEENGPGAQAHMYVTADVLTTMNTRGTRMEPPIPAAPTRIVKPDRHPCSVWHTIHIPKFPHPHYPLNGDVTPEVLEKREHWVRAHRADYRRGKGLFGRIHGLIWVPEHKRGNPELGTVKQSFEVAMK